MAVHPIHGITHSPAPWCGMGLWVLPWVGMKSRARLLKQAAAVHPVLGPLMVITSNLPAKLVLLQWYSLVEAVPEQLAAPAPGTEVRRGTEEDIALLVRVGEISEDAARDRMGRGHIPYIAFVDGVPVGYKWFHIGEWTEVSVHYPLTSSDAWSYDLYVDPAMRGRGVGASLTAHAVKDLARAGVQRTLSAIYRLNASSLASSTWSGATVVGSLFACAIGPWQFVKIREKDGAVRRALHRRANAVTYNVPAIGS